MAQGRHAPAGALRRCRACRARAIPGDERECLGDDEDCAARCRIHRRRRAGDGRFVVSGMEQCRRKHGYALRACSVWRRGGRAAVGRPQARIVLRPQVAGHSGAKGHEIDHARQGCLSPSFDRAPNCRGTLSRQPGVTRRSASIAPSHRAGAPLIATVRAEDEFRDPLVGKTASLCKTLDQFAAGRAGMPATRSSAAACRHFLARDPSVKASIAKA